MIRPAKGRGGRRADDPGIGCRRAFGFGNRGTLGPPSGPEGDGTAPPASTRRGQDPNAGEFLRALLDDRDGYRRPGSSRSFRLEKPDVALEGDTTVLTVPSVETHDHAEPAHESRSHQRMR